VYEHANMMPLVKRSSKWPAVNKAHLKKHPRCAACGGAKKVRSHHKVPVHVDPSLELEPTNLITLCEGGETLNCHLWCGHLGHWRSWNEHVAEDAEAFFGRIVRRPFK
jgi:5-methylcytosine-specific restriction enzyme A